MFLVLSGCTNPYSQFYNDHTGGKNILDDPKVIIPTDEPKLRRGSNADDDTKNMLENGYLLIGVASFNAGEVSENGALEQAKRIHADTVIVYSHYTHTLSGMTPITVPDTQTSYQSGTIYGSRGGSANYSGSSTTYGSTTTYMPYHIRRYDYLATYWVKMKPSRIGIYSKDLTDELRQKIGSNKGVYITIVVKDSPAFNSDLLVGDIIRRVNGIEVIDQKHYLNWLNETHPSEIEFEIFRNGENITKKVKPQYSGTATDTGLTGERSQPPKTDQKNQEQPNAPVTKSLTVIQCETCGHKIGKLEKAYVHDGHIVCSQCFLKLKQQP